MATVKRFEDLECWKSARRLCKLVYKLTRKEKFSKDFTPVDQVRSSSGSAMDNISERFDRGGNKEFIHFLSISRGSVGELKSQFYRALDQEYIDDQEFQEAYSLASLTGKQISGLMNYLKNSSRKGFKYP
ncbi:MAG: four helix bundle protein [Bacteroides sp. SM23_62_1]|nr:MAG: four helix bundle protein [Bacteroides sp. SM23_62_1]